MPYDFSRIVKVGNKLLIGTKNNIKGLIVPLVNGDTTVPPEPSPEPEQDCTLKNNSITAEATYSDVDNYVEIGINFENDDSYADVLKVKVNNVDVSNICSSTQYVTIYENDFETYHIQKGKNTLNVEVTCEDHPSYSLTTTCNINIPESQDPIEEYQVTGLELWLNASGAGFPEAYTVEWDDCYEDYFTENCKYLIIVTDKNNNEVFNFEMDAFDTGFVPPYRNQTQVEVNTHYWIDGETYTFNVYAVDENGNNSKPATETVTYIDTFHEADLGYINYTLNDNNNYELSFGVEGAEYYEIYLNNKFYKKCYDYQQPIELIDMKPGTVEVKVIAYNHKNTPSKPCYADFTVDDPFDSFDFSISNVSYYNDNIDVSFEYTDPYDIYSNLNLKLYVDNVKIYDGSFSDVYSVDVSEISKGYKTLTAVVTSELGKTKDSTYEFEIERCGLIGNTLNADVEAGPYRINADVEAGPYRITIQLSFENDVDTYDSLRYIVNGNEVYINSSDNTDIEIDDYQWSDFGITPGQDNTLNIEVVCDNHSEQLSTTVDIYVPEE